MHRKDSILFVVLLNSRKPLVCRQMSSPVWVNNLYTRGMGITVTSIKDSHLYTVDPSPLELANTTK